MKNTLIVISVFVLALIIISVQSCNIEKVDSTHSNLSSADKIKIMYKSDFDSTGKINVKTLEITNQNDIYNIAGTISDEPFSYVYCISTGSMTFYKDDTILQTLVFNTLDDYRHIAYNYENKLIAVKLSEENANILKSYIQ